MADSTANIKVNVTSTGDEALAKNAANTAASYKSVEKSLAHAAANSKRVPMANAAAKKAAIMENQDYNMGRSLGGSGTGAAGRDFAQQAQGLGGFVRLYATFAANIFAATAAFSALSKAMDTTNMVKGLDQLGAASGRNLGYLSKSLAMVSDGAVSLREAMEATAKASSAGLTNDQILRLGSVAKNASQALGVGMPDALSRLSRGISKIEPELLDELGIFVRVDKAVQDYARSMGRTASSLSDFERRQAYATAVLKEGEQKFSDISLASNSYAKLLASLTNVAQKVGEVLNTALGPFAKLLAENTALLTAALAGVVGLLLSKAIPAMTQWRTNLAKNAQQASETAKSIENSFGERFVQRTLNKFKIPELQADVTKLQKAGEVAGSAYTSAFNKAIAAGLAGKNTRIISSLTDTQELGTREVRSIENRIKTLEKAGNVEAVAAGKELLRLNQQKIDLKQQEIKAVQTLKSVENAAYDVAEKKVKRFSEEWQRMAIARRAASRASSLNILSDINVAAREGGVTEGFQTLRENVFGNKTLTAIDKFKTTIKGAFVIATSAVTTFLSAVGPWLQIIALIAAALPFVYSSLTKTAKEAEATAAAIDTLTSSTENLSRTLDNIAKKDPLGQLSIGSALAKNTALVDLGESLSSAIDKAFKQLDKISNSTFDSWINWIKKLWGGDVQSVLNESLAGSISMAFKALGTSSADMAAKEELKKLLKYTGEDAEGIEKALNAIGNNKGAFQQVAKGAEELSKKAKQAVASLTALRESQDAADKSLKDFLNSFLPQDNLSKFGQNIMDVAINLRNALNDPRTSTEALLASFNRLEVFSPQVANSMANIGEEVRKAASEYKIAQNQIESYNKAILEQQKIIDNLNKQSINNKTYAQDFEREQAGGMEQTQASVSLKLEADKELQDLIEGKRKLEVEILPNLGAKVEEYRSTVFKFTIDAFKQGADIVASRLNAEWAKAANVVTSGFASLFGDTKAGIILREQAENRMIEAQMGAIRTQLELIKSNKSLEIQVQRVAIDLEKQSIESQLKSGVRSDQNIERLANRSAELDKELAQLQKRESFLWVADNLGARALKNGIKYLENKQSITKEDEQELAILQESIKYAQNIEGALAQMAQLGGQVYINKLKTQLDLAKASTEEEKKRNDIELQSVKNKLDYLNTYSAITGPASIVVQQELNQLKISELLTANKAKELDINREIAYNNKLISELQAKASSGDTYAQTAIASAKAYTRLLEAQKQSLTITQTNQIAVQEINNAASLTNKIYEERNRLQQIANKEQEDYLAFVLQLNANEMQLLEIKKSFNGINETIYIQEKNRLEQLKLETEYTKTIADIEKQRTAELDKVNKVIDTINSKYSDSESVAPISGIDLQILEQQYAERDRINKSYSTSISRATTLKQLNLDQLDLQTKLRLEAERWDELFKGIAASTLSLTALFGEMGAKIGLATEGLAKLGQIIEQNAIKEKDAQERVIKARKEYNDLADNNAYVDPKKLKEVEQAEEALTRQKRKSTKDELSAMAALAGATKNLFDKKTAAYKVLATTEKALHIARLTMDAIEMASNAKKTVEAIAGFLTEKAGAFGAMIVDGGKAVVNAMTSLPFPASLAAGAAMAAAVAAVISSVGGSGGPSAPSASGITSAEQQQTQGTGYAWDKSVAGKMNETGFGVFGDPGAKIDNINKSLEIVRDKSINFLPIFNEMVMLLDSIDKGIRKSALSLYGQTDLRTGTMFDNLRAGSEKFNLGSIGTSLNKIPVLGPALNSLFGSKKIETNVTDWGIVLADATTTFGDLVNNVDSFNTYVSGINTITKKSLFGLIKSTSTEQFTTLSPLDQELAQSINSVFVYAQDLFVSLGEKIGRSAEDTVNLLNNLKLTDTLKKLSVKDLKGDELEKEFASVVGEIFNIASDALFGFAKQYQQFGEDFTTTIIRVIDTNEKVTYALKNIGIDFEKGLSDKTITTTKTAIQTFTNDIATSLSAGFSGIPGIVQGTFDLLQSFNQPTTSTQEIVTFETTTQSIKEQSIAITESLVEMAGGMEEFAKGINFYMENFLTEQERNEILTKNVTSEVARLNSTYSKAGTVTLNSVDNFKKLIKALDLTSEADRKLYTDLMNLAPAFYELYAAGSSAEEAANKIAELTAQLYRLQGRTDEAIAIERKKALEDLKTDEEKTLQQQIWLLEDELKLRKLNVDLMSAEGKTFEALLASREEELRVLTNAERVIKNQVYAAQDAAKSQALDLRIMKLQGEASGALRIERNKELFTLSNIIDASGKSDRMRQEEIWALEDASKMRSMDIELLNAQGLAQEALTLTREEELRSLTEEQKLKKQQIYDAQDAAKNMSLYMNYLKASGKTAEAIARERAQELRGASAKIDPTTGMSDRQLLQATYAAEDLAKQRALEIELMEAQGYGYNALIMNRKAELRTLSASEKVLKKQVYAAQDAMKTYGLQIQLMRAMGNETGALAAERELELRNLSETDQAIQKLIWQYEDQKEAADKLKDSLDGITSSLKDNIKSLEEYKKSLLMGEESPLSTGAKYQTAKNDIFSLLNTITAPAETPEQQAAQADAVSKLQSTSSTFLELSRTLYASSAQYNTDFGWIMSILDAATGSLEKQLTDAEKQLAAIELSNEYLKTLNETALKLLATGPMAVNYDSGDMSPLTDKLEEVSSKLSEIVIGPLQVALAETTATEEAKTYQEESTGLMLAKLDQISISMAAANDSLATFAVNMVGGITSVASSVGNQINDTFINQITGLQLDTRNVEAAVYNSSNNNAPLLQAMIDQLRVLNEKVAQLEVTTAEVGLLNVEATRANTSELTGSINESVSTNLYTTQLQNKAMIA